MSPMFYRTAKSMCVTGRYIQVVLRPPALHVHEASVALHLTLQLVRRAVHQIPLSVRYSVRADSRSLATGPHMFVESAH